MADSKPDPAKYIEEHILERLDPEFVQYYTDTVLTLLEKEGLKALPSPPISVLRQNPAKFRTQFALDTSHGVERVADYTLTSEKDGGTFPARLYHPDPAEFGPGPYGLHINFHGGGFVLGDLQGESQICLSMREAGVAVLDVNYRHCPETVWGKCFEDAWASLTWARAQASTLNIRADSISIGGISAGAHITLVVQQRARDEGVPLRLAMPTVPPAAGSLFYRHYSDSPYHSMFELANSPILPWNRIKYFADLCLSSTKLAGEKSGTDDAPVVADEQDRQACMDRLRALWPASWLKPMDLERWEGLCESFVRTGELDNLRDEGEAYAQRLVQGGNKVTSKRYLGSVHTFMMYDVTSKKKEYDGDSIVALRQAHGLVPLTPEQVSAKVEAVIEAARVKRAKDEEKK